MFLGDPRMSPIRRGEGFVIWRNAPRSPGYASTRGSKAVVVAQPQPPVRYRSNPIVTLPLDALRKPRGWTTYGTRTFETVDNAIRARASSTDLWPILARRIPVFGSATYIISAEMRTKNVSDAHLKMMWFRRSGDSERLAMGRDYGQPVLSGSNPWTRVSAVIESPPGARFGEVAFLAGRRPQGSRRPAISWVRNIRVSNVFIGDQPSSLGDAVTDVVEDIDPGGYEIVEAERVPPELSKRAGPRLPIGGVVVNPGPRTVTPPSLRELRRSGGRVEIVARAHVTLRPQKGGWQARGASAVVVSEQGRATLPLGEGPSGRYNITLTGCELGSEPVEVIRRFVVLEPTFRGPGQRCGRSVTRRPVLLNGRVTIRRLFGETHRSRPSMRSPLRRGPLGLPQAR